MHVPLYYKCNDIRKSALQLCGWSAAFWKVTAKKHTVAVCL
jgi:hypothetical protein